MIQRIQTLLLLAAVICAILMFLIPSFCLHPTSNAPGESYETTLLKTSIIQGNVEKELLKNWPLVIMNGLLILLYLITIFDYRKRTRQVQICNVIFLIQLGLVIILFYDWKQLNVVAGQDQVFTAGWGIACLIISIVLVLFARRFILKDEALVRSADRLR